MLKSKEVQKNKVLVYYALAIVLPCIALGALAFRGVRNDQALVERENQRKVQEIGGNTSGEIYFHMDSLEQVFRSLEKPKNIDGDVFYFNNEMKSFDEKHSILKGLFYFSPELKTLAIPGSQVIYLTDDATFPGSNVLPARISQITNEGWKFEFRDRNYKRAITYYSDALQEIKEDMGKAMITNIMARNYRKMGKPEEALEAYRMMADKYSNQYLQGGIPAGITAYREIIKLYLQEDQRDNALDELSMLLDVLTNPTIPIKQAYFQNTLDEINTTLSQLDHIPDELNVFMDGLTHKTEFTKYLHHFQSQEGTVGNLIQNQTPRTNRSLLNTNDYAYYFAGVPEGSGTWILLYDPELCFSNIAKPHLDRETKALGFNWALKSDGEVANTFGQSNNIHAINYTFEQGLPGWQVEFIPGHTGTMLSLMRSGKGVYLYIFILILVILIVGLFFTLYTINQEMRLSRMKSFFISTVSHEFKSPITSIRQMAEMLDRDRVKDPERKKVYYSTMLHESERLSHLVENILDFARMEQGKKQYHFKEGNIAELIGEVVDTFRVQMEGKGFLLDFIETKDLPKIKFDKEAMEQVIHNLIDNAIKYSGNNKRVEVSLELSGMSMLIHVRDWGLGIPKVEQEKIFDRFYRVGDELTARVKGSGIGLTIVQQIVKDHNGQVNVKSKPGEGSTFTISLPIKSNHAKEKDIDR